MGILNKPLWAILGLLALGLAVSVSSALYFRGEANTLRVDLNAVQRDLAGLQKATADKKQVDTYQSDVRATKAKAVRAVRAKLDKENASANDSHLASPAQLNRLRRLVEAGNAGIRSARELP